MTGNACAAALSLSLAIELQTPHLRSQLVLLYRPRARLEHSDQRLGDLHRLILACSRHL